MEDFLTGLGTVIVILVVAALILGLPIMVLWNWLMPTIFGLPFIGFWQAVGMNILAGILFKNTNTTSK